MKTIFLSAVAILAFGMASAQTDPKQVPQTTASPQNPATTTPEMNKSQTDAELQNDVMQRQNEQGEVIQSRKAEVKTDHIKATPDVERVRDTVKTTTRKTAKKRKS